MNDGNDLNKIRKSAMDLLARREHSTAELRRKLDRRGHSDADIETVLQALIGENLLSDGRFAEAYCRVRVEKGYGPVRIRQELKERGVEEELIEPALEGLAIDWQDMAERVREKKFGSAPPADYNERTRQSRFLYQRGFSGELINRLFRPID